MSGNLKQIFTCAVLYTTTLEVKSVCAYVTMSTLDNTTNQPYNPGDEQANIRLSDEWQSKRKMYKPLTLITGAVLFAWRGLRLGDSCRLNHLSHLHKLQHHETVTIREPISQVMTRSGLWMCCRCFLLQLNVQQLNFRQFTVRSTIICTVTFSAWNCSAATCLVFTAVSSFMAASSYFSSCKRLESLQRAEGSLHRNTRPQTKHRNVFLVWCTVNLPGVYDSHSLEGEGHYTSRYRGLHICDLSQHQSKTSCCHAVVNVGFKRWRSSELILLDARSIVTR